MGCKIELLFAGSRLTVGYEKHKNEETGVVSRKGFSWDKKWAKSIAFRLFYKVIFNGVQSCNFASGMIQDSIEQKVNKMRT